MAIRNLEKFVQFCNEGKQYSDIAALCGVHSTFIKPAVQLLRMHGVKVQDPKYVQALMRTKSRYAAISTPFVIDGEPTNAQADATAKREAKQMQEPLNETERIVRKMLEDWE